MKGSHICQSCSMPIETSSLHGTEKDGSRSGDYCIYCYEGGAFTAPGLSLDEMKAIVREQIDGMKIPADLKEDMEKLAERLLPGLKRWKKN